jgi:hypothetical protein
MGGTGHWPVVMGDPPNTSRLSTPQHNFQLRTQRRGAKSVASVWVTHHKQGNFGKATCGGFPLRLEQEKIRERGRVSARFNVGAPVDSWLAFGNQKLKRA